MLNLLDSRVDEKQALVAPAVTKITAEGCIKLYGLFYVKDPTLKKKKITSLIHLSKVLSAIRTLTGLRTENVSTEVVYS